MRDEQFNPLRDRLRGADGRIAYTPQLAAMLIYLNRTGFNGLFRVNARGAFNVPAGRYERPRIADRDKLARVARSALQLARDARVRLVRVGARASRRRAISCISIRLYAPLSRTAQLHVVHRRADSTRRISSGCSAS